MRIVYLTTESLYGKINSGSLMCSYSNFMMLKRISEDNLFHIYLDTEPQNRNNSVCSFKREENRWKKLALSLTNRRYLSGKKEIEIANLILKQRPDLVFYEGPYWSNVISKLKSRLPKTVFVLFMHNVEKFYYENLRRTSVSHEILYRLTCKCEEKSIKLADKIICLNSRDGIQMQKEYGRKADMFLPINIEDKYDQRLIPDKYIEKTLLFIGTMFPPNYDGVKWFVENVMPELPEYKLVIVGRGFEEVKESLKADNVEVIGSVDNLTDYYMKYPILIMPIFYGAGMKVKTAEAMMYGKSIFATEEALEGYNASNIEGIYECNTKEEFISGIKKIFDNDMYQSVQNSVRQHFLENFETNKLYNKFRDTLHAWMNKESE